MCEVSACYMVPGCNLAKLQERIEQLNKRALRLGVPGIRVATSVAYLSRGYLTGNGHVWVKDGEQVPDRAEATGEVMPWHAVSVTGVAPKFDGWHFVATLEPISGDDGTVNLLMTVPGETCPHEYRSRVGQCDHCNTERKRNQTFVVKHDNGTTKMIGRNCLKDFLGHNDPQNIAAWAELLIELGRVGEGSEDEGWGGGGGGVDAYDLVTVLEWTASVIMLDGWVSKGQARDNGIGATADTVAYLLRRPMGGDALREWEKARKAYQPGEVHGEDAAAAKEWAVTFTDMQIEGNNYLANCNAVAKASYVTYKTLGIACSIVSSYQREKARLKLAATNRAAVSEYVGTVGKRLEMTVTVLKIITIEGQYGTCGLHKMVDAAGNDVSWFASGANWLEEGETYKVKATPKKHEEYKGRKQTMLNRVTVID